MNILIVNRVWTCACLGRPQDLDFSCSWTWSASSQSRMSSSSDTVAPPSVPPSVQSFWGQHTAARRTHLPRPLWTSLRRATVPPGVTLILLYNQSFKEWGAKERRKCTTNLYFHLHIKKMAELHNFLLVDYRKHQRTNEHRELSLLAYLSQLQSPDPGPIRPLHSLTPYQVHENQDAAVVSLIGLPVFYYYHWKLFPEFTLVWIIHHCGRI